MSDQLDFGTHSGEMGSSMFGALIQQDTERLRLLIEQGADVNAHLVHDGCKVTTFNYR